jgi:hypothetical protein
VAHTGGYPRQMSNLRKHSGAGIREDRQQRLSAFVAHFRNDRLVSAELFKELAESVKVAQGNTEGEQMTENLRILGSMKRTGDVQPGFWGRIDVSLVFNAKGLFWANRDLTANGPNRSKWKLWRLFLWPLFMCIAVPCIETSKEK